MNRVRIGLVVIVALLAAGAWVVATRQRGTASTETRAARYHCPMHVSYTSDKPGTCPICGMTLVPATPGGAREVAYYRSPMDPSVRSDKPAKDSMGMDFVPVY